MKKLYLFFILILSVINSYSQSAEFDANDVAILKAIRDNAPADSPLKADWADNNQIGVWAGVTWNNSVPARVTDLDFDSQKLTTLNVSGLTKLQTLWCPNNRLTSLDLSGLINLEAMECIDNQLISLNLSGLTKLDFIRCENNQLTSLDVSSLISLSTLNCSNNQLTSLGVSRLTNISYLETEDNKIPFSHLPLPNSSFISYQYSPQNKVFEAKEITAGQEIDYSSEATIDGTGTKFSWYKNGALIAGTTQDGKYTPTEPGDFYCKMTNAKFPGLTLISNTVTVMGSTPEFDPNDISVLKAIRDKAPANSPIKTLWTDESLIGSWAGVTWDNYSPKRTLKLIFPEYANLTNLDVTGLNNLQYLECLNNQLVSLKASGLAKLEELYCAYNKLTSLNLSDLTNLKILYCAENLLSSLDISRLKNLEGIDCRSNQIASLDFSGLTKIQKCYCSDNLLTSLNISGLTSLKELACDQNQLTSLDVSGLVYLEKIYCSENMLESFNLSGLANLQSLHCDFNSLSKLDLSGLTNLATLTCSNCHLNSLDISGLANLRTLAILANNISFSKMPLPGPSLAQYYYAPQNYIFDKKEINAGQEIDYSSEALIDGTATVFTWYKDGVLISGANHTGKYIPTEAGDYYCEMTNSKFPGLTLTTNTVTVAASTPEFDSNDVVILKAIRDNAPANSPLKTEWADESQLSSWFGIAWDNSSPKRVFNLTLDSQNLTNLNLSGLSNLKIADCKNNHLTSLNISGLDSLKVLYCANNQLTSLNLNGLTNLGYLDFSKNLITSIDLTGLTSLVTLQCEANSFTSIDLSGLVKLQALWCGDNPLSTLDLSGLTNLGTLFCNNCQLSFLDISRLPNLNTLAIMANNIQFSKMPVPNATLTSYQYSPQNKIFETKEINAGQEIDYSSEALIDGTATVFSWFKDGTFIAVTDQTGKYTPTEAGDYYCEMTNSKFPGLTLTTHNVTVVGVTTGPALKLVSKLSGAVIPASNVSYRLFLKTNNSYASEDLTPVIKGDTTFFLVSEGEWIVLAVSNQTPEAFAPTYIGDVVDWSSSESILVSGQEIILKEISCIPVATSNVGTGQISGNIYEYNVTTTKSVSILSGVSYTGNPISGALIQLFKKGSTIPIASVFSDSQGHYEFDHLEITDYEIAVEIPGFVQSERFKVVFSENDPAITIKFAVNTDAQTITENNRLLSSPAFKIYPNPNSGKFTISGNSELGSIEVYNSLGEQIFSNSKDDQGSSAQINLSKSDRGIYFVRIHHGNQSDIQKVVVQ